MALNLEEQVAVMAGNVWYHGKLWLSSQVLMASLKS
jgi:hypothetical protein